MPRDLLSKSFVAAVGWIGFSIVCCRATPVTITDTVDFAPNVHITQEDMRGVMMDAGHKPGLVRIETLPRMRLLKSVQVG